ncbi:TetR/AcrR family transcriptional regulator [Phycicoccus avicenniae]|uniref:TetR/AcrR family transcriptional regulator n=1 Tax=Phycicoccus avicenniae TaxID=2828860 RepID=UPI003D2AAE9A
MTTRTRETFHHGDLRAALVSAARAELTRVGVSEFSLRAVVRAVGVAPSAVYHHFSDRDALLGEVATDGFRDLAKDMEAAVERAPGPLERVEATGRAYLVFAAEHPALFDLMFAARDREARPTFEDGRPGPAQVLARELDRCVEVGVVRQQVRATAEDLLWPAVHGRALLEREGRLSADEASRTRFFSAVRASLGAA